MSKVDPYRGKRKKLFVDQRVQTALLLRMLGYWCFCLLTITLMLLCWRILTGPARMFYMHFDDLWFHFGPALVASFLLLPLVMFDVLRLSNRFVGPMVRLRRGMRSLAEGQPVSPIVLREGDFWQDFAGDFNNLARAVQHAQASADPTAAMPAEAECSEEECSEEAKTDTSAEAELVAHGDAR